MTGPPVRYYYEAHNRYVPIRFTQSARRHRIGRAHVLGVIATVAPAVLPAEGALRERLVWVGPDHRGLVLEIVVICEPDQLLVVHAMPRRFRRRHR